MENEFFDNFLVENLNFRQFSLGKNEVLNNFHKENVDDRHFSLWKKIIF